MTRLTLSVPAALRERMTRHPEIRWSEVVRAILARQLGELEEAERLASKSRLTARDVDELSARVDTAAARRWAALKRPARAMPR